LARQLSAAIRQLAAVAHEFDSLAQDRESIRSSCEPYLALLGLAESHYFSQGSGSSSR
jgi:hypothetical protein